MQCSLASLQKADKSFNILVGSKQLAIPRESLNFSLFVNLIIDIYLVVTVKKFSNIRLFKTKNSR